VPFEDDDGTLGEINRPSMLESGPETEQQTTPISATEASNDLNAALRDLQSLKAPPAEADEPTPKPVAPPRPLIQLAPIVDPGQLPKGR